MFLQLAILKDRLDFGKQINKGNYEKMATRNVFTIVLGMDMSATWSDTL
jgi:hypothetical protein